jgi:hypothetical protein
VGRRVEREIPKQIVGIFSPPYFDSDNRRPSQELQRDIGLRDRDYGSSKGQIGNLSIEVKKIGRNGRR